MIIADYHRTMNEDTTMFKGVRVLSIGAIITTLIDAIIGIFYSTGALTKTVHNIYGQEIVLFGDGIYANDSLLKAGAAKGTDMVMILVACMLFVTITTLKNKPYAALLQAGLLSCLLYSSVCLIMGVSFNRLFLMYLLQFSFSLFAFILSVSNLLQKDCFSESVYNKKFKGTAIFLMVGACSVLIWLEFIIPAVITGIPGAFIEIYTTEPTYAIDLGIILPSAVFCGIRLLQQNKIGYKLAPVLLTLVSCVGICVITQTIVQYTLGIRLNSGQFVGLVLSFIILGSIATVLNIKLLKYAK